MNLIETLKSKRKQILSTWVDRTLDSYVSSGFFKRSRDKFANPVGVNIREGLSSLFDLLLSKAPREEYLAPLDQVIRIRAVQEFTPAQAVAPILELKWVVRQVLSADKNTRHLLSELDSFDCDIDRAALAAFDMYTACREQLYENRIRELKSGSYILTDSGCPSSLARRGIQDKPPVH
ncbi:RsbRD N-terminal domain-containing protein [Thermodesulfobacteriota bacterium B35]